MDRAICHRGMLLPAGFYALVISILLAACNVSDSSQREPLADAGADTALDADPDGGTPDVESDGGDADAGCVDGEVCSEQCIDPMTSTEHCGGCGTACAEGEVCTEGACGCAADQLSCEEQCVAVLEDPMNCGECGITCRSGACADGVCVPEECDPDGEPFGGGAGSVDDPFRICAAEQLMRVGEPGYRELNFGLFSDLDMSVIDRDAFTPIGSSEAPFAGSVDGRGYAVRNLRFGRPSTRNIALFAELEGELRDLHLVDVDIEGNDQVAALVIINSGTIVASSVQGTLSAFGNSVGGLVALNDVDGEIRESRSEIELSANLLTSVTGGLVGQNRGAIIASEFEGSFFSADTAYNVGGLVGRHGSQGTITDSHASGEITIEGNGVAVGGLVGEATDEASITNSSSEVNVSAPGSRYVGGLVGYVYIPGNQPGFDVVIDASEASGSVRGVQHVGGLVGQSGGSQRTAVLITDSHASGAVRGSERVGGFVGTMTGTSVTQCSATGDVEGQTMVGGLFGSASYYTFNRCYATGDVSGEEYVGGLGASVGYGNANDSYATGNVSGTSLVGGLIGSAAYGGPRRCYAIGEVLGSQDVGGLVGRLSSSGSVVESYWNITTSGIDRSADGTGLYANQFTDVSRFVGWDFEGVWEMSEDEGRPVLRVE